MQLRRKYKKFHKYLCRTLLKLMNFHKLCFICFREGIEQGRTKTVFLMLVIPPIIRLIKTKGGLIEWKSK
jgi:hypothetical protein